MVIDEDDLDSIAFEGYHGSEDYFPSVDHPSMTPTAYMLLFRDMYVVDKIKDGIEQGIITWTYSHQHLHSKNKVIATYSSVIDSSFDGYSGSLEFFITKTMPLSSSVSADDQAKYDLFFVKDGSKSSIDDYLIGLDLPFFFQQIEQSYSKNKL